MKTVLRSISATEALHASGMTLLALIRSLSSANLHKMRQKKKHARMVQQRKLGNAISSSLETKTSMMLRMNANVMEDTWRVHNPRRKMKPSMLLLNEGKAFFYNFFIAVLHQRLATNKLGPLYKMFLSYR